MRSDSGLPGGYGRAVGKCSSAGRQAGENRGEIHAENRSAVLSVVAKDGSAMFLHDAVTDAQAKSRAFANGLGRVKGVEDAMRLADSRAVIGKEDHDITAVALGFDD